jgi:hypothetical protein
LADAISLWRQRPILGIGQGNYAQGRLHDLTGPLIHPHASHAHNIVAQALAEWGAVGAVVILGAGWFLSVALRRRIAEASERREVFLVAAWIISLVAHSMVEHPFWFMRFVLPLAVMMGLLHQPQVRVLHIHGRRYRALTLAALVLGLLLCGVAAWDYHRTQALAARLAADADASATGKARVPLGDALSIASLTMSPRYAQILLARALPLSEDLADEKLEIVARSMNSLPEVESIARYVAFAVVAGKGEEGLRLMNSLQKRNSGLYSEVLQTLGGFAAVDPRVRAFVTAQEHSTTAN